MNIPKRFISQVSTPQEVDAAPEHMTAKREKSPDGPSATTAAAWRNSSGKTA